jgi:hypothetical protein
MYLRRAELSRKQKEQLMLLDNMKTKRIVFLKRDCLPHSSNAGTFFALSNTGQCIDITYSLSVIFDVEMFYVCYKHRVIELSLPESSIRDLSDLLYDDWDAICLYTIE